MSYDTQGSLTIVSSPSVTPGAHFVVDAHGLKIGRSETNTVRLFEDGVIEEHAIVQRQGARFIVETLNEDSLTTINRIYVHSSRPLYPGDIIQIGQTILRFDLARREHEAAEANSQMETLRYDQALAYANDTPRDGAVVLATSRFFDITQLSKSADVGALRRDFDRVKTAFDAVCALLNTFDLEALCERTLDAVFALVQADRGSVQLRRADDTLWTAHERASAAAPPISTTISTTVVEHVLEHKEAVLAMDVKSDERFSDAASIRASQVLSLMAVPLLSGDDVLGILHVVNDSKAGAFGEADLDLMSAIGVGAGMVLANNNLYNQLEDALGRQVAFNETLRHKVDERTRELRDKNTELSATLAQLEATQDRVIAQEKLASLGALASGIAHEMLNPMNFVNNFAGLIVDMVGDLRDKLEAEAGASPDVHELLHDIQQASRSVSKHGQRVVQITQGMRQLSNSQGGERTRTQLNGLLLNLVSALRHSEQDPLAAEVDIVTQLDPDVGELSLSVGDIGRALLNLLHNALYAVRARAASAPAGWSPEVLVETKDLGERVRISIRDNGAGIPEDIRPHVFDPFFTTKPPDQGIGLGLSIAHDVIVKIHGGELEISSEPDRFTDVSIVIPRDAIDGSA